MWRVFPQNVRSFWLTVFRKWLGAAALVLVAGPAVAQDDGADAAFIGELMAFHGSRAIVSAMTTHCYETTGLDNAYRVAADNWYLRNVGFLDLANRVAAKLGGVGEGEQQKAETYAGTQIMSAYNQADSKDRFCQGFLEQVNEGALDIDKQLPEVLKRAQEIASE